MKCLDASALQEFDAGRALRRLNTPSQAAGLSSVSCVPCSVPPEPNVPQIVANHPLSLSQLCPRAQDNELIHSQSKKVPTDSTSSGAPGKIRLLPLSSADPERGESCQRKVVLPHGWQGSLERGG